MTQPSSSTASDISTARRSHRRSTSSFTSSHHRSSRRRSDSIPLKAGPYDPDFEAAFTPSETDGESDNLDADGKDGLESASTSAATIRPPSSTSRAHRSFRSSSRALRGPLTTECDPDCRCSDRDVLLGKCSRSLAPGTTSPSSDEASEEGWLGNQGQESSRQEASIGSGSGRASRSPLKPVNARSSQSSASSDLLKKPVTHIIDSSSESEPNAYGRYASWPRNEAAFFSMDRSPTPRQGLPRHRRTSGSRSISQASHATWDMDDAVASEDHKRRRREERDRLIRQRIEQKRLAARNSSSMAGSNGISVDQESTGQPLSSGDASFGSHHRERSFNDDMSRLHRISHPPSANSVAAFAAHVSPSKSEARRTALQKALHASQSHNMHSTVTEISGPNSASRDSSLRSSAGALDLPPLPAASEEENRSHTSLLQEGIRLLNKDQLRNRRASVRREQEEEEAQMHLEKEATQRRNQANTEQLSPIQERRSPSSPGLNPSSTGFSFTPQTMLKSASPTSSSSSSMDSPRQRAHRRSRGESTVVSLNARLPPSDTSEARKRLSEVLRSPHVEISEPSSPDGSDARGDATISAESKTSKSAHKSVRFSPNMEYLEPLEQDEYPSEEEEEENCNEDEHVVNDDGQEGGGGEEQGSPHDGSDEVQIDLDNALEKIEQQESDALQPRAPQVQSTASDASPREEPSPVAGTPVRLPPGAFRSPAAMPVKTPPQRSVAKADATLSFSQHVLRRHTQTPLGEGSSVSATPTSTLRSVPGTPLMPGAMRFHPSPNEKTGDKPAKGGVASPPLRAPRRLHLDRGLPPSYSAVTSGQSPQNSMSWSASGDSNLDVLGEEGEEEPEAEVDSAPGSPVRADEAVSDVSAWHDQDDGESDAAVFSPPRESTPPPPRSSDPEQSDNYDISQRSMSYRRNSSGARSASISLQSLKPIEKASLSSEDDAEEQAETSGNPHEPRSYRGEEHAGADESLRLTLQQVVEVLKGRVETREKNQKQSDALLPKDDDGTVVRTQPPTFDEQDTVNLKQALELQLKTLDSEETQLHVNQTRHEATDEQQLQRLQTTRRMLLSGIEILGDGKILPTPEAAEATSSSLTKRAKAATSLALVQALILWLMLVAVRHGSEHLYQTTYYDPFYPHVHGTSALGDLEIDNVVTSSAPSSSLPLGMVRVSPPLASSSGVITWVSSLVTSTGPRAFVTSTRVLPFSAVLQDWTMLFQYLKNTPSQIVRALLNMLVDPTYGATDQSAPGAGGSLSQSYLSHTFTPV